MTTTAPNGSQAAPVTTIAPSGSLVATVTTTTPSGSEAVASALALLTAPGGSTTTTGALGTSVITLPCTQGKVPSYIHV